jgi:hypothetical protein
MSENEVVVKQDHITELSTNVFSSLENIKEIFDIGKMFASSTLVPKAYQGQAMDCTIAVDMANRMGVSPMMVMQNLYVVQGKPSWSGQACKSLIDGSNKFKDTKHVYIGERNTDTWGCYLQGIRLSDSEVVNGPEVTIKMAKEEGWYGKTGSKWKTMPELMLAYRASAFFARVHIPNALMGVSVEGEVADIQKQPLPTAPNIFESEVSANETN